MLDEYRLKIQYHSGKENQAADALSRRPDLTTEQNRTNHAILKKRSDGALRVNVLTVTKQRDAEAGDLKIRITNEKDVKEVIRAHHESKEVRHPKINKTIQLIQRNFVISELKKQVQEFIFQCEDCQTNKVKKHRPYGEIEHASISEYL